MYAATKLSLLFRKQLL